MIEYQEVAVGGIYNTQLVCQECGSVVWDKDLHDKWHARMDLFKAVQQGIGRAFEDMESSVRRESRGE